MPASSRLNDPSSTPGPHRARPSGYLDASRPPCPRSRRNFNEPSDTGLTEQLNTFWNDWSTVANNPGDGAARSALLAQASTVTDTLNSPQHRADPAAAEHASRR